MSDLSDSKREGMHSQPSRVRLIRSDRDNPFPEYRLMGLVGQGQFAQVYYAIHKQTGELAAIKQTRHEPEQPSQEPFVLGELCHPNIVCCQAIAQTKAGYQFVLDYCEAGTLRSHLDMHAPPAALLLKELVKIALDILHGLSYIHQEGVIHGDLKPENILLSYQPQSTNKNKSRLAARIGDFGSARFVGLPNPSLKEIGSPTYAAPERFQGKSSYASDIYSIGVILYELLLGDRPFSGSPDDLRQAHQTQAVPFRKAVSLAVQQFLQQALEKRPDRRFSSVSRMLDAFQNLLERGECAPVALGYASGDRPQQPNHLPTQVQDKSHHPSEFDNKTQLKEHLSSSFTIAALVGRVQQLITTRKACFAVAENAVYRLDEQQVLRPIVAINRASQVAFSPDGSWLIAIPNRSEPSRPKPNQFQQPKEKVSGQLVTLESSGNVTRSRTINFEGWRSHTSQTKSILTTAIDRCHIIEIAASTVSEKSSISCFTREGKQLTALPINVSLSHAALASEAYQIVAIGDTKSFGTTKLFIISLRPLQIRSVLLSSADLCSSSKGISAFPWGFSIVDEGGCLFLDRAARPVGRLNLAGVCAIAPLPYGKADGKAIVAIARQMSSAIDNQQSSQMATSIETTPVKTVSSSQLSILSIIDLRELDLDLIF